MSSKDNMCNKQNAQSSFQNITTYENKKLSKVMLGNLKRSSIHKKVSLNHSKDKIPIHTDFDESSCPSKLAFSTERKITRSVTRNHAKAKSTIPSSKNDMKSLNFGKNGFSFQTDLSNIGNTSNELILPSIDLNNPVKTKNLQLENLENVAEYSSNNDVLSCEEVNVFRKEKNKYKSSSIAKKVKNMNTNSYHSFPVVKLVPLSPRLLSEIKTGIFKIAQSSQYNVHETSSSNLTSFVSPEQNESESLVKKSIVQELSFPLKDTCERILSQNVVPLVIDEETQGSTDGVKRKYPLNNFRSKRSRSAAPFMSSFKNVRDEDNGNSHQKSPACDKTMSSSQRKSNNVKESTSSYSVKKNCSKNCLPKVISSNDVTRQVSAKNPHFLETNSYNSVQRIQANAQQFTSIAENSNYKTVEPDQSNQDLELYGTKVNSKNISLHVQDGERIEGRYLLRKRNKILVHNSLPQKKIPKTLLQTDKTSKSCDTLISCNENESYKRTSSNTVETKRECTSQQKQFCKATNGLAVEQNEASNEHQPVNIAANIKMKSVDIPLNGLKQSRALNEKSNVSDPMQEVSDTMSSNSNSKPVNIEIPFVKLIELILKKKAIIETKYSTAELSLDNDLGYSKNYSECNKMKQVNISDTQVSKTCKYFNLPRINLHPINFTSNTKTNLVPRNCFLETTHSHRRASQPLKDQPKRFTVETKQLNSKTLENAKAIELEVLQENTDTEIMPLSTTLGDQTLQQLYSEESQEKNLVESNPVIDEIIEINNVEMKQCTSGSLSETNHVPFLSEETNNFKATSLDNEELASSKRFHSPNKLETVNSNVKYSILNFNNNSNSQNMSPVSSTLYDKTQPISTDRNNSSGSISMKKGLELRKSKRNATSQKSLAVQKQFKKLNKLLNDEENDSSQNIYRGTDEALQSTANIRHLSCQNDTSADELDKLTHCTESENNALQHNMTKVDTLILNKKTSGIVKPSSEIKDDTLAKTNDDISVGIAETNNTSELFAITKENIFGKCEETIQDFSGIFSETNYDSQYSFVRTEGNSSKHFDEGEKNISRQVDEPACSKKIAESGITEQFVELINFSKEFSESTNIETNSTKINDPLEPFVKNTDAPDRCSETDNNTVEFLKITEGDDSIHFSDTLEELTNITRDTSNYIGKIDNTTKYLSDLVYTTEHFSDLVNTTEHLANLVNITEDLADVVNTTEHLAGVVNTTEHLVNVVNTTEHLVNVVNTTEHLVNVVNTTEHLVNVVNTTDHLLNVVNTTDHLVNVVNTTEHLVNVVNTTEHLAIATEHLIDIVNATDLLKDFPTVDLSEVDNNTKHFVPEDNSTEHFVHEDNSTEHLVHEDNSTEHFVHEDNSTEHLVHEDNSTEHFVHEDNSTEHFVHEDNSTEHFVHEDNSTEHSVHEDNSTEHLVQENNSTGHLVEVDNCRESLVDINSAESFIEVEISTEHLVEVGNNTDHFAPQVGNNTDYLSEVNNNTEFLTKKHYSTEHLADVDEHLVEVDNSKEPFVDTNNSAEFFVDINEITESFIEVEISTEHFSVVDNSTEHLAEVDNRKETFVDIDNNQEPFIEVEISAEHLTEVENSTEPSSHIDNSREPSLEVEISTEHIAEVSNSTEHFAEYDNVAENVAGHNSLTDHMDKYRALECVESGNALQFTKTTSEQFLETEIVTSLQFTKNKNVAPKQFAETNENLKNLVEEEGYKPVQLAHTSQKPNEKVESLEKCFGVGTHSLELCNGADFSLQEHSANSIKQYTKTHTSKTHSTDIGSNGVQKQCTQITHSSAMQCTEVKSNTCKELHLEVNITSRKGTEAENDPIHQILEKKNNLLDQNLEIKNKVQHIESKGTLQFVANDKLKVYFKMANDKLNECIEVKSSMLKQQCSGAESDMIKRWIEENGIEQTQFKQKTNVILGELNESKNEHTIEISTETEKNNMGILDACLRRDKFIYNKSEDELASAFSHQRESPQKYSPYKKFLMNKHLKSMKHSSDQAIPMVYTKPIANESMTLSDNDLETCDALCRENSNHMQSTEIILTVQEHSESPVLGLSQPALAIPQHANCQTEFIPQAVSRSTETSFVLNQNFIEELGIFDEQEIESSEFLHPSMNLSLGSDLGLSQNDFGQLRLSDASNDLNSLYLTANKQNNGEDMLHWVCKEVFNTKTGMTEKAIIINDGQCLQNISSDVLFKTAEESSTTNLNESVNHQDLSECASVEMPRSNAVKSSLLEAIQEELKDFPFTAPGKSRMLYKKNNQEDNLLNDDKYIYCGDCCEEYDGACPVHGPMVLVVTKKLKKDGSVKKRALKTLPSFLTLGQSGIKNAGLGVWTETALPPKVVFGPYEGCIVEKEEACKREYTWEVRRSNATHYIDGSDERFSNWLRYVNCPIGEERQNLVAFQYKKKIYYRTYKRVLPHTELLVWYGRRYAEDLGINLRPSPKLIMPDVEYKYGRCHSFYEDADDLQGHLNPHFPLEFSPDFEGSPVLDSFEQKSPKNYPTKSPSKQPFTCIVCEKTFKKKQYLLTHQSVHTGEKPHLCNICNKGFTRAQTVVMHQRSVHMNIKPYECSKCERAFAYKSCKQMHEKTHDKPKLYKCPYCEAKFAKMSELKCHISNHHLRDTTHRCVICKLGFGELKALRAHIKRSHPAPSLEAGETLQCDVCPFTSSDFATFQTHMLIHADEKPFSCLKCPKRFKLLTQLSVHMRVHSGKGTAVCTLCQKSFSCVSSFLRHNKFAHSDAKPYVCSFCDKSFAANWCLQNHERTHTGQRPHKCPHCDQRFSQSHGMSQHIAYVHTRDFPHHCSICGKGYLNPKAVIMHLEKVHPKLVPKQGRESTLYKCKYCSYTSNYLTCVKRHMCMHTGDRPFVCHLCPKSFIQKSHLELHHRLHTGERPLECDLCPKTFRQKAHLDKHMKSIHRKSSSQPEVDSNEC